MHSWYHHLVSKMCFKANGNILFQPSCALALSLCMDTGVAITTLNMNNHMAISAFSFPQKFALLQDLDLQISQQLQQQSRYLISSSKPLGLLAKSSSTQKTVIHVVVNSEMCAC